MKTNIVIPNWNGAEYLPECLDSVLKNPDINQSDIIVVDNGSTDDSKKLLKNTYAKVNVIALDKNRGFAGGVNAGIKQAFENEAEVVLLLNNDTVVKNDWVKRLVDELKNDPAVGIVTSKIITTDTPPTLDTTGEFYSSWGLPYPRGRGETKINSYDSDIEIFGASGAASAYRVKMLKQIGLFDERFFAYYEDVDLSFRAQLAGWQVRFAPKAVVSHRIGGTSGRIKGFTTYHTFKNLPWLLIKNVPHGSFWSTFVRFTFAYVILFGATIPKLKTWYALKGLVVSLFFMPVKISQRIAIQHARHVSHVRLDDLIYKGIPPNYVKLRHFIYRFKREAKDG